MMVRTTVWIRLVALAALLASVGVPGPLRAAAPPPRRAAGDTAWTFRSAEYNFALTLPSSAWKKGRTDKVLEGFYFAGFGSRMLVGIHSVQKQTPGEFRATVKAARARFEKLGGVSKPTFEEAKNDLGDRRVLLTRYEKGGDRCQYLFVTHSLIWVKEKSLTVHVFFEGQGVMESAFFQRREKAAFEKAARAVHRSVR